MFDMKKEKIKKRVFLGLAVLSAFMFISAVLCTIMGEESPVKFIINDSPVKLVVPPALAFFVTYALYRNSKKAIEENTMKR